MLDHDSGAIAAPAALRFPLVLASASTRRAGILAAAGLPATVAPSDVFEDGLATGHSPERTALDLARAKAARVAGRNTGSITLGADTVVVVDGDVLGKPADPADAIATLRRLRGRAHDVITAVALDGALGRHAGYAVTGVRFRHFTDGEIDRYVASGAPMDKAGSYGIQDRPFAPAERVNGCYLNVVGLPLCLTADLLAAGGLAITLDCTDCSDPRNVVCGCGEARA